MSQSIDSMCKAIIEQGTKKGNQCDRPRLDNGYCGKHCKVADLDAAILRGEQKCSRHRCNNTFIYVSDTVCKDCSRKKEELSKTIQYCSWKELVCKSKSKQSGFCGKHEVRGLLLQDAEKKGVRICDDGKRSCKNITIEKRLHCEDCLKKYRKNDNETYHMRKENMLCVQCGINITDKITGIRNHKIQQCEKCYTNTRKIEDSRKCDRNYSSEKKINPQGHFRQYLDSACKRNLKFELQLEDFIKIVNNPCHYCEYYSEVEVIGIDRVDSSIGYTLSNVVPACEKCNMAKGELSIGEFESHIMKIADVFIKQKLMKTEDKSILPINEIIDNKHELSYMRPNKIVELYLRNKLDIFIDLCIKDKRSQVFIDKLKELSKNEPKLSAEEFKKTIKNILFIESRSVYLTEMEVRKRIPRKEIMGFLESNNIDAIVNIYEKTFGHEVELRDDFIELSGNWKSLEGDTKKIMLEKLLIKYQNRRANRK